MDTEQDDVIHELEAELLRRIETDDDGEQPDEQLLQPHGTLADLVGPLDSDADDDDDAADPTFSGADERATGLDGAARRAQGRRHERPASLSENGQLPIGKRPSQRTALSVPLNPSSRATRGNGAMRSTAP